MNMFIRIKNISDKSICMLHYRHGELVRDKIKPGEIVEVYGDYFKSFTGKFKIVEKPKERPRYLNLWTISVWISILGAILLIFLLFIKVIKTKKISYIHNYINDISYQFLV